MPKRREYEDRLELRYRKLKTRKPICVGCGETDPFCLEEHHIAGSRHHQDTVIVCRNCHRKLSNLQLDHVPKMAEERTGQLAKIGHYLLGVSDSHTRTAATLRRFGDLLIADDPDEESEL